MCVTLTKLVFTDIHSLRSYAPSPRSTTDHPDDTILPDGGRRWTWAHLQRKLRALDDHWLAGLDHAGSAGWRFRRIGRSRPASMVTHNADLRRLMLMGRGMVMGMVL